MACGPQRSMEHLFSRCDGLGSPFQFLHRSVAGFSEEFSERAFTAGVTYRVSVWIKACNLKRC